MSNTPYELAPHEFIQTLFSKVPSGYVEIAYLSPEGMNLHPRTVVQWAELPLGDIDPALPNIHSLNEKGYSCYFAPAVRVCKHGPEERTDHKTGEIYTLQYPRGKAKEAQWITALWADVDLKATPDAYQRLIGAIVPPSIVVKTGGGYHGYWMLTEPLQITDDNRESIKQTLKGMAIALGSDTTVADLARVMRLPGTTNTKPGRENRLCEVMDFIPGYYHYMDFELNYSPLAKPAISTTYRQIKIEGRAPLRRWVETYLDYGEAEGNRNTRAYAAARWLLDNGYSLGEVQTMVGNRALSDGLPQDEVDTILSSAERSERKAPDISHTMQTRMSAADKRLKELS
jgi:hypothetical protein